MYEVFTERTSVKAKQNCADWHQALIQVFGENVLKEG